MTRRLHLRVVRLEAPRRKAGLLDAITANSTPYQQSKDVIEMDVYKFFQLLEQYPLPDPPAAPAPAATTAPAAAKPAGLGDVVASLAHPIAKALNLDCLDPKTDSLKPGSPCDKRRQALNNLVPFKS